jgi:hypothetical protein
MAIYLVYILIFGPLATLGLWGLAKGHAWGGWVALFCGSRMLARASTTQQVGMKTLGFAVTGAFAYAAVKEYDKANPFARALEQTPAEYYRLPGYTGPLMADMTPDSPFWDDEDHR